MPRSKIRLESLYENRLRWYDRMWYARTQSLKSRKFHNEVRDFIRSYRKVGFIALLLTVAIDIIAFAIVVFYLDDAVRGTIPYDLVHGYWRDVYLDYGLHWILLPWVVGLAAHIGAVWYFATRVTSVGSILLAAGIDPTTAALTDEVDDTMNAGTEMDKKAAGHNEIY